MGMMICLAILITIATGLIAKTVMERMKTYKRITWKEFAIVVTVMSVVVAPLSIWGGWEMAKKNKVTFNEFWNGWELQAYKENVACERDGSCHWEYDCDPYLVTYSCNCDKDGCDTCMRTEYHSCPYVKTETHYYVATTLGDFAIAKYRFPEKPQQHRWRQSEEIPNHIITSAGVGEPKFWTEAKERVDSGYPGPATKRMEYANYLYASEQTILKQYSSEIESFKNKKLFPVFQNSIYDYYYANKVYFVGERPENEKEWLTTISYFNGALGKTLEGDLHLVLVQNEEIASNPDVYALALKAYWQDIVAHERNAMSKNSILVIALTDGNKITWARSFTGMPLGNESLTVAIDDKLRGAELKPEIVIGNLRGKLVGSRRVENEYANGILEKIVFGLDDESTKFKRISMSAKDVRDNGSGFLYLLHEIQPSGAQKAMIFGITFVFCLIGWAIAIAVDED